MKKTYFKFHTVSLFLFLIAYPAFAQKAEGYLQDSSNKPVAFANVVLFGLPDSSFINGAISNEHGHFMITYAGNHTEGYLHISCMGFETIILKAKADMGRICLKSAVSSIQEVIVKGSRPVIRNINGKLLVNVSSSFLSKAGNVFDALRRSPGITVDDNNKITVFGRGVPIIFLNGRELKNPAELATLQSSDIVSFEIDRNPSAEYAAAGNAVIKITTKKAPSDAVNFQLYNEAQFAKRYRNSTGGNLNGRFGSTDFAVNYSYTANRYKNLEEAYENNFQDSYTITNRNSAVRYPSFTAHNIYGAINQAFYKKHVIGAQVTLKREDSKEKSQAAQTIARTDRATVFRDVNKSGNGKADVSTYSLNYLFKMDSARSLSLIGDYSKVSDISAEKITELNHTNSTLLNTLLDNRDKSEVYSAVADFETPVFRRITMKAGGKYAEVKRQSQRISTNIDNLENNYTDNNAINDQISAAYLKADFRVGAFTMNTGLRYERTETKVRSLQTTLVDSTYGEWFPSVSFSSRFRSSRVSSFTFGYTRKIDRPAFRELSTNVIYFDANSYAVGNPRIRPTLINNFSADLSLFRGLSLNFGHRIENSPRVLTAVPDDRNPTIIKYTFVNLDKAQYSFVNIDYSLSRKWYEGTLSTGIERPSIKVPFLGEVRKVQKLNYILKVENNFSLSDKVSVFCSYVYYSRKDDLMTHYYGRYNLSVGGNASILKDKLKISLLANDILNKSDTRWEDKYANIISGSIPDHDNTWVRLIVRYHFRNFKKTNVKRIAGEEELDRM
ncbi:outer membrane beta-barrel family protein [Filimonas effusa]|uniref:TonB-dependent receptor n=1 Tax=Filimonas effusa TaxID=2508721 RepID=A0A4Q1D3I3_9BACT|nr:outer membrane beta-barrel family protein [Filimonas effusa]RXK82868.1 TonB-dependent receptor [Filimonas effusa]